METTWRRPTASTIVKLNVGGQNFQTASTTLAQSEYFQQMLNGKIFVMKDENGAYFFDRDPKYFEIILSFLRTSHWNIPSTVDRNILMQEMRFYMIKTTLPPTADILVQSGNAKPPSKGYWAGRLEVHQNTWADWRGDYFICLHDGKFYSRKGGHSVQYGSFSTEGSYLIAGSQVIGVFINNYQDIICGFPEVSPKVIVSTLLESKRPTEKLHDTGYSMSGEPPYVMYKMVADSEKVVFTVPGGKKKEERQIHCTYSVDPDTQWTTALCPELSVQVFVFGHRSIAVKYDKH